MDDRIPDDTVIVGAGDAAPLTDKQIRWLNSRRTGNEYKARIIPMPRVKQGEGRNGAKKRARMEKKK